MMTEVARTGADLGQFAIFISAGDVRRVDQLATLALNEVVILDRANVRERKREADTVEELVQEEF